MKRIRGKAYQFKRAYEVHKDVRHERARRLNKLIRCHAHMTLMWNAGEGMPNTNRYAFGYHKTYLCATLNKSCKTGLWLSSRSRNQIL